MGTKYTLTRGEQDAIGTLIGIMLGELGEECDISQFNGFSSSLTDDERDTYDSLYELFEIYHEITDKTLVKEEEDALVKFLRWIDENDADIDNEFSYECSTALEKLEPQTK